MTKPFSTLVGSLALLILGAASGPAFAQTANKVWVSSASGNDTGTCQFVAPCKTFAYAITQVAAGGELDVKDAGSYGTVTINKAVSIVSQGVLAAIAVPSGATGITVSAGSSDLVVLEGLTIDGHGVGSDGIDFTAGASLKIKNCHVSNVTNVGISLQPMGALRIDVSNSEVANAGSYGILLQPFNTHPLSAFFGLDLHDNATGFFVGYVTTSLTSSKIAVNNIGVGTEIGATILLGETVVSENTTYGIQNQGGTVSSYGDNNINGNGTDVSGSFTTISRR